MPIRNKCKHKQVDCIHLNTEKHWFHELYPKCTEEVWIVLREWKKLTKYIDNILSAVYNQLTKCIKPDEVKGRSPYPLRGTDGAI